MQVDSNRHRYPSGPVPGRGISLGDAAVAAAAAAAGSILMGGAAEAQSFTEPAAGNNLAAPEVEAEGEPSAAGGSWSSESAEGGW